MSWDHGQSTAVAGRAWRPAHAIRRPESTEGWFGAWLAGRGAAAVLAAAVVLGGCGVEWDELTRAGETRPTGGESRDRASDEPGSAPTATLVAAEPGHIPSDTPPGSVGEEPPAPVLVTYEEAERVFRAGQYGEAAHLFEAYAARRPENPWGHYMLGIAAWRAGDHERGEAALRRTVEVAPEHERGLLNLARVMLEQRKASDALDFVERVVVGNPELGEGWRVLGNARADLGMTAAAIDAYRTAIALDPEDAWTMNNLGLLLIRAGRYDDALPPLARATELRPGVAVFQNNLGVALERSGYLPEAAEAYLAALAADPEHEPARVSLERVSSQSLTAPMPPLDLAGLAAAFAEEVQHWRDRGFTEDAQELQETLLRIGDGC